MMEYLLNNGNGMELIGSMFEHFLYGTDTFVPVPEFDDNHPKAYEMARGSRSKFKTCS